MPVRFRIVLAILLVAALPDVGQTQNVHEQLWVTNGYVNAITTSANRLYAGGNFTQVGPGTGAAVALDLGTAQAQVPYAKVAGAVYAIAPDGAGGWYIGGSFTHAQAKPRANLAHIDANGDVTAWNPGTNGPVRALLFMNGVLYVGGEFTYLGGLFRTFLGAVGTNGVVTTWYPGSNAPVRALAAHAAGSIFAGGDFTLIAGGSRNYVTEISTSTATNTAWNPGTNGPVHALRIHFFSDSSNRVYIGGQFTMLAGLPRNNVGAVTTSGALSGWNPGTNGLVRAIHTTSVTIASHVVYLGGDFTLVYGVARRYLAQLTYAGVVTGWDPNPDGVVRGLGTGIGVYVAGDFTTIGGEQRPYLAELDLLGYATEWDPAPNYAVHTVATTATKLYAGGAMTSVNTVRRSNLAAFDRVTGEATPFNPGADGTVHSLALNGDTLYVGGDFATAGGALRKRLAAFHAETGAVTTWNPQSNGPVYAMLSYGGSIRVGGNFFEIGGTQRAYICGLHPITGLATSWQPNADNVVYAMAVRTLTSPPYTTTIFAGGLFDAIGYAARSRIGEVDPVGGAATSWNPPTFGISSYVFDIEPHDVFVWVGGAFYDIGGQPRAGIAALYGSNGALSGWNANTSFPCQVYALALHGGYLFTGGYFTSMGSEPRHGLAEVIANNPIATGWDADVAYFNNDASVADLETRDFVLYVGGSFTSIRGLPHSGIAALSTEAVDAELPPTFEHEGLRASPNPFQSDVTLRLALRTGGAVEVAIYDVAGRRVRELFRGELQAGQRAFVWDGRDDGGRALGAGVYFARVDGAARLTAKVLRLR